MTMTKEVVVMTRLVRVVGSSLIDERNDFYLRGDSLGRMHKWAV
jgi:hypothetical protein